MNFAMSVFEPLKSNFGDFTAALPSALLRNATCAASCLATMLANVPVFPENFAPTAPA